MTRTGSLRRCDFEHRRERRVISTGRGQVCCEHRRKKKGNTREEEKKESTMNRALQRMGKREHWVGLGLEGGMIGGGEAF
jgi:hypothetical protein